MKKGGRRASRPAAGGPAGDSPVGDGRGWFWRAVRAARAPLTVLAGILITASIIFMTLVIVQGTIRLFHVVEGDSMYPQVKARDAVVLKQLDTSELEVGEVVVFRDPERRGLLIIHRVVGMQDGGGRRLYETKGDNNPLSDPVVIEMSDVVGGVALRLPGFGRLLEFITSGRGYIALVGIPAAWAALIMLTLGLESKPRRGGGHAARHPGL